MCQYEEKKQHHIEFNGKKMSDESFHVQLAYCSYVINIWNAHRYGTMLGVKAAFQT